MPAKIMTALAEFAGQRALDQSGGALELYALADAGQDRSAWQGLLKASAGHLHLLSATGSTIDDFTPYLIHLGPLRTALDSRIDKALSLRHAPAAYSLLCSPLPLPELRARMNHFTEVELPGRQDMILAYWDPAILGTLIGQVDDDTLHVPGPILEPQQLLAFLHPVAAWWYWDREADLHRVSPPAHNDAAPDSIFQPFRLNQAQEDALVEAGVPDQILYHIEQNQPTLFDAAVPGTKRYRFIRAVLPSARLLDLEGMRDLVNFVALCLIYRQRMETDTEIHNLLAQAKDKTLSFDEALQQMPE